MRGERIINEYFEWLLDLVCGKRYSKKVSYRRLLSYLHSVTFNYSIPNDVNRANDGIDLRYRFAMIRGYRDVPECLDGPCSIFEMMAALAIRCEETIMDDPSIGDRTGQWFWNMLSSLGLSKMSDLYFDEAYVSDIINRFLNREYEPNGKGGLFTIENTEYDLREVDIWTQFMWYLEDFIY